MGLFVERELTFLYRGGISHRDCGTEEDFLTAQCCLIEKATHHHTSRLTLMQEKLTHFLSGDSLFRRVLLCDAIGKDQYKKLMRRLNMDEHIKIHNKNIERLFGYMIDFPNMYNLRIHNRENGPSQIKGRYYHLAFTITPRSKRGLLLWLHWNGKQYFDIPPKTVQDEDIHVLGGFVIDKIQNGWIKYGGHEFIASS